MLTELGLELFWIFLAIITIARIARPVRTIVPPGAAFMMTEIIIPNITVIRPIIGANTTVCLKDFVTCVLTNAGRTRRADTKSTPTTYRYNYGNAC